MYTKTVIFIFFLSIIFIWLIAIEKVTMNENNELQAKEVKGKILRMFKKDSNKNYTVIFSDGSDFDLPYSAPSDRIDPGDSMFKAANSVDYIFFKGCNSNDTIVFHGKLNGKFRP